MKKNGFLTFCCSFMPGAGQMYQGYMKRGVCILSLFIIFIAFSAISYMSIFSLPAIIVYIYSFFDTWNIRNRKSDTDYPRDDYIWNSTELKGLFSKIKISKKNNVLGIILILIGIYILFGSVFRSLAYTYGFTTFYYLITDIMRYIPPILIAAISIALGIKFVTKK